MSSDKQIYFGIDLGTTNSCVAFGTYDPLTNSVKPSIMKISQRNSVMGMEQRTLLPSAVYFDETNPVVGIFARDKLQTQPSRVVFSIKNYIGTNQIFEIENEEYTPQYLSSLILKHIKKEVENRLNIELSNAVIGVPASFDQDMRAATIEAAKIAGFSVVDVDGSPKDVLIDEPRATLYEFVYKLGRREIIVPDVDFSKEQMVLVFDLGGGTLDVSLHEMKQNSDHLTLDDIAISRYTQLGGDVFDRLLASHFKTLFLETNNIKWDSLSELDKYEVDIILFSVAERVKKEMTSDITNKMLLQNYSLGDLEGVEFEVAPGYILDSKFFYTNITKKQYDEIISELLGWKLSIEDVKLFLDISTENSNNIIYPILDVLHKAKIRLGKVPQVDFVLLNGGMTRVQIVKQRLEEFFGFKPYEGLDPDLSIALGACIHHYNLSQGKKLTPILAETVGLGIKGTKVKHLVPAGTALPYVSKWERYRVSREGVTGIKIPLYVGERTDRKPPNRKILERQFRFFKKCKKDEPVYARIKIDRNKTVTFEYYLQREPKKVYVCEANVLDQAKAKVSDTRRVFSEEMEKTETLVKPAPITTEYKVYVKESDKPKTDREQLAIRKPPKDVKPSDLLVRETVNQFVDACRNSMQKSVSLITEQIINSKNFKDFILPIGSLLRETHSGFTLTYIYTLLGKLIAKDGNYKQYNNYVNRMTDVLRQIDRKNPGFVKYVIGTVIVSLGDMKAEEYQNHVLEVGRSPNSMDIRSKVLITLGKIGNSKEIVSFASEILTKPVPLQDKVAAAWCLGRVGSRERAYPLSIEYFTLAFDFLIDGLRSMKNNIQAVTYYSFALGTIGNQLVGNNDIPEVTISRISDMLCTIIKIDFKKR